MKTQLKISLLALVTFSRAIPSSKSTHEVEALSSVLTPAAVPNAANTTVKGFAYLGCQTDSRQARVLSQKSVFLANMTLSSCSTFCAGSLYFGTEYQSECYCSNTLSNTSISVKESDCWMSCSGNANQTCGGTDRISVFKNTNWIAPPAVPKTVSIPGYAFRGCYIDKVGDRTLNGPYFFDGNMTTSKCSSLCKGSTYFGTEYGGECYCASTIPAQAKEVAAKECSVACKGDQAQACGGGNRLSVYWKIPGF
jgi:hypothetical protein